MFCKIFIDKECEERVLIYTREKTKLCEKIEQLVSEDNIDLVGFIEREAIPLQKEDISCFISEDDKVFALTDNGKLRIKARLYKLEEELPLSFVKINQSCIANIKMIERFDSTVSGTLKVKFKNGYCDYVSRRCLKAVKERFGIK